MSMPKISLDLSEIPQLVGRLSSLDAQKLARANVRAVNAATDEVYDLSRKRMNAGINLDDDYLRRKMQVTPAQGDTASATITASGARNNLTLLSRYDAKIIYAPRKARRARPTTGGLSLPSGMRQNGVSVQVSKGGGKTMEGAFMLPLRAGGLAGANGYGVFLRDSRGKKHHLYGPSVYQLFRHQVATLDAEVLGILEKNMSAVLDQIVTEVSQ